MHSLAYLIAVDDERAERRDHEEGEQAVEQRGPRGDKVTPSQMTSTPAIAPTSVERLIRRTIRITSTTITTPSSAPVNRQPTPL